MRQSSQAQIMVNGAVMGRTETPVRERFRRPALVRRKLTAHKRVDARLAVRTRRQSLDGGYRAKHLKSQDLRGLMFAPDQLIFHPGR